jgi:hypothetical protein
LGSLSFYTDTFWYRRSDVPVDMHFNQSGITLCPVIEIPNCGRFHACNLIQGTFGLIQETFGLIQGTFSLIQ